MDSVLHIKPRTPKQKPRSVDAQDSESDQQDNDVDKKEDFFSFQLFQLSN